jgi:riboflavin kinase / FMN adenylyltransferase
MTCQSRERAPTLWRGLEEVPAHLPRCALTIGVFDGVHRGHAQLIHRTRQLARLHDMPTVLVTFDPHPARVLQLPRDTAALSTLDRRAELAHQLGVDAVCALPFTPQLARMSAEDFTEHVLVRTLHAGAVVVGTNFTFGRSGGGDLSTLRRLGMRHGFHAEGVELARDTQAPFSSTYIRGCLNRGDVQAAAQALGRPHRVDGVLTHRAEVLTAPGTALPAPGRYHGQLDHVTAELEVTSCGKLKASCTPAPAGSNGVLVTASFLSPIHPPGPRHHPFALAGPQQPADGSLPRLVQGTEEPAWHP